MVEYDDGDDDDDVTTVMAEKGVGVRILMIWFCCKAVSRFQGTF